MIAGHHIATTTPSAPARATPRALWAAGVGPSLATGNGMAIGNPLPCAPFGKRGGYGGGPGSAEGAGV